MFDIKFKEMQDAITQQLVKEYGMSFFNLSKERQCELISYKFINILKSHQERQA